MNIFKQLLNGVAGAASSLAAIPGMPKWAQVAAGGLGSMFAGIQQENSANTMMAQQMELLQNQQNFQREIFNRALDENHNSIINQFRQYRQLGINPLSLNGGMNQSNVSAPSAPSAPAASYTSPLELAQIRLANAQTTKTLAEANAIDPNLQPAQTKNLQSQTFLNQTQAENIKMLQDGQIKLQGLEMENMMSATDINRAQYRKIMADCKSIQSSIDEINERVQSLRISNSFAVQDKVREYMMQDAQIKHMSNQDKAAFQQVATAYMLALQQVENMKSEKEQIDLGLDYAKMEKENGVWNLKIRTSKAQYLAQISESKNTQWKMDFDTYSHNDIGIFNHLKFALDNFNPLSGLFKFIGK